MSRTRFHVEGQSVLSALHQIEISITNVQRCFSILQSICPQHSGSDNHTWVGCSATVYDTIHDLAMFLSHCRQPWPMILVTTAINLWRSAPSIGPSTCQPLNLGAGRHWIRPVASGGVGGLAPPPTRPLRAPLTLVSPSNPPEKNLFTRFVAYWIFKVLLLLLG